MENCKKEIDVMAATPIGRLLLRFAAPCVLSMLVSALYNIVDQIFIGQSIGYIGNAATTVVYPFTVVALALALLIGDGCAALFSLSRGRKDDATAKKCVANALLLTVIVGVGLTLIGFLLSDAVLKLFGVTADSYVYAKQYYQIILIGIPFYVFASAMNSYIRANGSPAFSMISTCAGAVINIVLDPIAIFALNMGIRGAAVATVIGQAASFALTLIYFFKKKSVRLRAKDFRMSAKSCAKVMKLGVSSFITQFSIVVISCVANNLCNVFGAQSVYGADVTLSTLGIVFKVFGIVIAFSVGIAVGGQPIIGYNYGAGNYARVRRTYYYILAANAAVGLIAMALFQFCPQAIIRLFGSESALYNEYANLCFRIYLGGILLCCLQKCSSIFLQSIGKPVQSMLLSLSRDVVFLLPGVVILAFAGGVTGMLWAGPIADVLSIVLTAIVVLFELRALRRKQQRGGEIFCKGETSLQPTDAAPMQGESFPS